MNLTKTRDYLQEFEFQTLFVEELGWLRPTSRRTQSVEALGEMFSLTQIAALGGVVVFEAVADAGAIPSAKVRAALHKEVSKLAHENLLIFVDKDRVQSLWYWVKREKNKALPRDHYFTAGQPGDLFLSKLSGMVVDISELDSNGNVPVTTVAKRLSDALDVEKVTKKFFKEFKEEHDSILGQIAGIDDDRDRRWYASVLLNRLMFVYFLQRKFFLNGGYGEKGNGEYLQRKLTESTARGENRYFRDFLRDLFFIGFAKPRNPDDPDDVRVRQLVGEIPYLNGGIFLPHPVEVRWKNVDIPDVAFENLFRLFGRYSWNLNDTPNGAADEINPDTLGYIFEKYINQKEFGAYYTRPEITEYLCEQTINRLILDKINAPAIPNVAPAREYESVAELLMALDAPLCKALLFDVLPRLSLLDPACGSGAFLVAAMKTLINVYSAVIGRIKFLSDRDLTAWLKKTEAAHPSINYFIKREIIKHNLFGVDIMAESTEIAKLRLFLALVASAQTVDQLEPLPNIDFNILAGNSLIGLLQVTENDFNERKTLLRKSYRELANEKETLVQAYRNFNEGGQNAPMEALQALRDKIAEQKREANAELDDMLLDDFTKKLGIKFEQATWNEAEGKEGRAVRRALVPADIAALTPFHWGYEFDAIMNGRGGFDAIITNPPWEIFKPQDKEFFTDHLEGVQKNKMRIEDFTAQKSVVLGADADVRAKYLAYLSGFPHVNQYYRSSPQYANQISMVNGKKAGTDINLYKLFTEQCYRLLRTGGYCGIVIPSGIYTDLGTKQLRELLFAHTRLTGLFCFENRREIFENVHRSFKFVVMSFEKGSTTDTFPTAFMRHDVRELTRFPAHGSLPLSVETIRALSPDSLSITEVKHSADASSALKMASIPLLADSTKGWGLEIYGEELHMTRSAVYFTEKDTGFKLYEGSMIWHFVPHYAQARYYVDEPSLRDIFLVKRAKRIARDFAVPLDMKNDYEVYRIAIRKIASSTNERTLITTMIPPNCLAGNSIAVNFPLRNSRTEYNELKVGYREAIALVSLLNSFVADSILRSRMTTNLNSFYLNQLPVPLLTAADPQFAPIVERAARLTCTTPDFDDLAREIGLSPLGTVADKRLGGNGETLLASAPQLFPPAQPSLGDSAPNTMPTSRPIYGVTDPAERARLRAELDGIIAHLYGLSEEEFAHILSTFPLVAAPVKIAAQNAYRDVARGILP